MTKAKKVKEIVLCMIFVAIILSVMAETSAATIQGKVYGPDLELAKKAVLEINSTPRQNLVSTDGTYSFVVLQGTYKIEAFYAIQGTLLYTNETITVPQEGSFTLDLILFETPDIEDIEFDEEELKMIEDLMKGKEQTEWPLIIGVVIGGIIIAIIIYLILKRRKAKPVRRKKPKFRARAIAFKEEKPMGDEAIKRTLDILKREHRVNQKDLRKELGISEAKASLIIADLESQGKVKKIKRGRGNIVLYQE